MPIYAVFVSLSPPLSVLIERPARWLSEQKGVCFSPLVHSSAPNGLCFLDASMTGSRQNETLRLPIFSAASLVQFPGEAFSGAETTASVRPAYRTMEVCAGEHWLHGLFPALRFFWQCPSRAGPTLVMLI